MNDLRGRSNSLSDVEREVARDLHIQAKAYREGTAGTPAAVARWLRILADKLEAK